MADNKNSIDMAKRHIQNLVGKNIMFKVNKGRNKYVTYNGKINNAFPSIFTIEAQDEEEVKTLSYSYNDVLTKVIRFYPPTPIAEEDLDSK